MKILFTLIYFMGIITVQAQLPQAFIKNASVHSDQPAYDVVIGSDGTIFVAYEDGLRAYGYDGVSFVSKAHIYNGGEARDLAISSDGTIFVANMWDGLRAYTYNGSSFTNTAHIYNDGDAHGVAVGPDGTIFLANLWEGLRAYTYNGTSFTNTAHINTNGDAHGVAVGPDGTIFLANAWDGLRAYTYNGSLFTYKAHINDGSASDGAAFKVEVDSSGTIFVGNGHDGLRAYTYNGSSFTNTAHINNGGEAWGIAIDSDGTVFLANDIDGLRAYIYDGNSFINTAHIDDGNYARDLAIGLDGTIFLASLWDGVFSYTYTGYGDIPFLFVTPNFCFQNNTYNTSISGINTHFSDGRGTSNVWMSKDDIDIQANSFQVNSNTSINAEFFIPPDVTIGLWDISVKTSIDSVITLNNAVDVVLEGNYALQFDGINDYVQIPAHDSLDMANSSVSVSTWIKSSDSYYDERMIIEHNSWDNSGAYHLTSWNSNHLRFYFENMNEDLDYNVDFTDGKWHHIVGMLDTDNNEARLYYDGVLAVKKIVNREIGTGTASIYIGSRGGEDSFFKGEIDEVRIWKKALTLQEIKANMYSHLTGTEDGLVGYWTFNEGSGNVANDLSGNNNKGNVRGAVWVGSGAPIGTVIIFCHPNYGYLNHNLFTTIQGANTHFSEGIKNIWISKDDVTITPVRYNAKSNTLIDIKLYIPPEVSLGQWGINVETTIDSIITMPFGIEVLPPPSVTSQNSSTSSWLQSAYAINDKICWSVGNDGSIQRTNDGGSTWESQESNISDILYSTFFADGKIGWAVGQYGTILSTTNGGEDWNKQTSGTSNNLQSVYFVDVQTGWTVGRSGTILKTTDGGIKWEPQTSGSTSWLYSVCFINVNNGWVVGSNGTILNTTDGGEIWESQNSGTKNYLSSVQFVDSDTGWVTGSQGTILKTTDGGKNWIAINSSTTEWLKSIFFKDTQTGWAVGTSGVLVMTLDGGDSWSTRKTWTNKTLNSVFFADEIYGWAVGETGTLLNLSMNNLATAIENEKEESSIPLKFKLYQNYPNPFNPRTVISYQLPEISDVELSIYNILGEKVVTFVSGKQMAGQHQIEWDGTDRFGQKVSSGIYLYKLITDNEVQVRKMILIK